MLSNDILILMYKLCFFDTSSWWLWTTGLDVQGLLQGSGWNEPSNWKQKQQRAEERSIYLSKSDDFFQEADSISKQ